MTMENRIAQAIENGYDYDVFETGDGQNVLQIFLSSYVFIEYVYEDGDEISVEEISAYPLP